MSEIVVSLFDARDGRTAQSRLKEAVDDFSREHQVEFSQGKVLYAEGGKPYLEGRAVEISISHSGDLWGCALSKEPVGLDIQLIREKGSVRWQSVFPSGRIPLFAGNRVFLNFCPLDGKGKLCEIYRGRHYR